MPTYAVYSHSDQTYGLYISGRILNYHLALYNAKVLYHLSEEEPTAEENLAYFINASIEKADSYISKTGGTPITNLSERDNQVIESYDYIFNKIPTESKALLKGKFEVYRSVNGGGMETIKTYLYE